MSSPPRSPPPDPPPGLPRAANATDRFVDPAAAPSHEPDGPARAFRTISRRTIAHWSIRWNNLLAIEARAEGLWIEETLAASAGRRARENPGALIVVDGVRSLDAATLHAEARVLAGAFLARGLEPGEAITLLLPNWHEGCVIHLAAVMAGLVLHPVPPDTPDRDLATMLEDIGSRMVFVAASIAGSCQRKRLRRIARHLLNAPEVVVVRGQAGELGLYESLFAAHARDALPRVEPDGVKLVLYTGGAEGRPRGVMHSHNTMHATVARLARIWPRGGGVGADQAYEARMLVSSTIGHIAGSIYAFELPWLFGAAAVLLETWEAEAALDIILRQQCTHCALTPVMLRQLLDAAKARGEHLPRLRLVICGGAEVSADVMRAAQAWFASARVERCYGSTEVPFATLGNGDTIAGAETDGWPLGTELELRDASGGELPDGVHEGELWARGPQMFAGYLWATQENGICREDGFVRMGDIARRDANGAITVLGRRRDMLHRGGRVVPPRLVEVALEAHPALTEAAMVSAPGEGGVSGLTAVVVARPGTRVNLGALRVWLAKRGVPDELLPDALALRPALPRSPLGKLQRGRIALELCTSPPKGRPN